MTGLHNVADYRTRKFLRLAEHMEGKNVKGLKEEESLKEDKTQKKHKIPRGSSHLLAENIFFGLL